MECEFDVLSNLYGLTGGIASGKSAASEVFRDEGFYCLDADQISRELLENDQETRSAVASEFGPLTRSQLRDLVFSTPDARKKLETLLHPRIMQKAKRIFAGRPRTQPLIMEAALFVETGLYTRIKGLIVVESKLEIRRSRLLAKGFQESLLNQIIKAQASDEERRKHATHLIVNNGSLDELRKETQKIARKILRF